MEFNKFMGDSTAAFYDPELYDKNVFSWANIARGELISSCFYHIGIATNFTRKTRKFSIAFFSFCQPQRISGGVGTYLFFSKKDVIQTDSSIIFFPSKSFTEQDYDEFLSLETIYTNPPDAPEKIEIFIVHQDTIRIKFFYSGDWNDRNCCRNLDDFIKPDRKSSVHERTFFRVRRWKNDLERRKALGGKKN